jgi:pimeloyl-ACP methyl ester carboxylesterase
MATEHRGCRRILFLALCSTIAVLRLVGPASAQSRDALREQCRAQYAYLRGPGQRENVVAHVRACMQAKMQALAHRAVTTSSGEPIHLLESTPWLVGPNKGPTQAKGVIYFVGGFSPAAVSVESYRLVPYYLKSFAENGWDVVLAKHPRVGSGSFGFTHVGGAAQTIRRRVAELKAQGYKRVVAGGHSWGGWAAMMAARDGAAVDALLLSAPNTFGPRISPITGGPNGDFRLVVTEFGPVLSKINIPTVLILPDDTIWDPDPGARGQIAEKYFTQANVPHLVIAKPPGFTGHFAGWLPFFDFAYGKCIESFLELPKTEACPLPRISRDDFRSILNLKQVTDADKRRITSAETLVNKKFDAYENDDFNRQYDYISSSQRTNMQAVSDTRESFSFRDGLLCTGSKCSTLIRWSEQEILEFDAKAGDLKAWWIEDK